MPGPNFTIDVKVEIDMRAVHRGIHRILQGYKDEKRGPTVIALQSKISK